MPVVNRNLSSYRMIPLQPPQIFLLVRLQRHNRIPMYFCFQAWPWAVFANTMIKLRCRNTCMPLGRRKLDEQYLDENKSCPFGSELPSDGKPYMLGILKGFSSYWVRMNGNTGRMNLLFGPSLAMCEFMKASSTQWVNHPILWGYKRNQNSNFTPRAVWTTRI